MFSVHAAHSSSIYEEVTEKERALYKDDNANGVRDEKDAECCLVFKLRVREKTWVCTYVLQLVL